MLFTRGSRATALFCALCSCAPALADFTNPLIPEFRGTPASDFFAWESFSSAFGGANTPNYAGTDAGAALFNFTQGASITDGGNLAGGASPLSVMAIGGLTGRIDYAVLNLSTFGSSVHLDTVRLTIADNAGHSSTAGFNWTQLRSNISIPGGGQAQTRAFKWAIPSGVEFNPTRFTIEFSSQGANMTLDAASIDFHYVPAPGALALIGFAGLGGSRRRRR